eukprot:251933_1
MDGINCDNEGDGDNVFGCGNPSTTWLDSTIGCGPFGLYLSNNSVVHGSVTKNADIYGWKPCGMWDSNDCGQREKDKVIHNTTSNTLGGVMCCRDTTAPFCQSEAAQDCAKCAKYGPCLNSVDPKCITTQALDCLPCEKYAVCGACAPGWDIGCIAEEWHQVDNAAQFLPDGSINIINETNYNLGTTCQRCDICGTAGTNPIGIPIPFLMNGECSFSAIFGGVGKADCTQNLFGNSAGKASAWKDSANGLMPDIDLTSPNSNWKDIFDCSNVLIDSIREAGDGPNPNLNYSNPINWNINVNEANAICYNSTFSEDCNWNENRTCSDKLWGICGNNPMKCPSALHCGPIACNMDTESNCIHIEIFDGNSNCDPVQGAGDYQAYVIADGTCRMDGSGRSYYTLGCNPLNQNISGYIGCSDNKCDPEYCDQQVIELAPFTCHSEDWMGGLKIAGLMNISSVCGSNDEDISTTMVETTKLYTTIDCQNDNNLDRNDCNDNECDTTNQNVLDMTLSFDVCNITPFTGNRNGLWDTIANCLCDAAIDNSGVDYDYSSDLTTRRRLNGRGTNNCDINIISYSLTQLNEAMQNCDGNNGVNFEFGIQICDECDKLIEIYKGFNSYDTKLEAINQILVCSNWAAKQIAKNDIGFQQFGNGGLTYTLDTQCEMDNESGVKSNGVNYYRIFVVIFAYIWKLY